MPTSSHESQESRSNPSEIRGCTQRGAAHCTLAPSRRGMTTIWSSAAPARVLLSGAPPPPPEVATGAATADEFGRKLDAHTGSSEATAAVASNGEAGEGDRDGEEEEEESDRVGSMRMRVGRIDAWRAQGFSSAREQREHHNSDLSRYNASRKRKGRPPITEDEFQALLDGDNDDVSSISGSEVGTSTRCPPQSTTRILNPRFWRKMAPYVVASNICQTHSTASYVIDAHLSPRLLSRTATYGVVSIICQAHCPPCHRHASS